MKLEEVRLAVRSGDYDVQNSGYAACQVAKCTNYFFCVTRTSVLVPRHFNHPTNYNSNLAVSRSLCNYEIVLAKFTFIEKFIA